MVKLVLLFLLANLVEVFEVVAAVLLVWGFALWLGTPAALIAAGVALLVKAVEMDLILAEDEDES